tara:strand:- start:485 stop:1210 length:726 start_codon:yes stop_codon:yes gene_type:complete
MKQPTLLFGFFATFLIFMSFGYISTTIVYAHIPFISKDKHGTAQKSLVVADIAISKVIYQDLTSKSPESWIAFQAQKDDLLYFQLGVPLLDDLKDFRPSIGLFSKSSNSTVSNLEVIRKFGTDDITEPDIFYEPFTKTSSWTFTEHQLVIPTTGIYYLATFSPNSQLGKVWVSIGKEEAFGPRDWISLPSKISEIKKFHSPSPERATSERNQPWFLFGIGLVAFCLGIFLLKKFLFKVNRF